MSADPAPPRSGPIGPPPLTTPAPGRLLAHIGNGHLGLRVGRVPLLDGLAIVNGFWGPHPDDGVPTIVPAPYPLAGDIRVGEVTASGSPTAVEFLEQRSDFATGELRSRWRLCGRDVTAEVDVVSWCSRTDPALALQEVAVRTDHDTELELTASIDTTAAAGRWLDAGHIPDGRPRNADAWLLWAAPGDATRCGLVIATEQVADGVRPQLVLDETTGRVAVSYALRVRAGEVTRLRSIVGLVPDMAHPRPERQAGLLVARGLDRGWDALRATNRAAWAELWRGRPLIEGPAEWQRYADASLYYLHSAASSASLASTGVFGLASGGDYHYYRGHVMWDVEAFAVAPLLLTDPAAARALLRFRSRTVPAARANAALHGSAGIQFPWEAGFETGEEIVPRWSKTDKDHVTIDVGLAFLRYVQVSGDRLFARLEALPVIAGVAEWLLSRVERTSRGYELPRARGPAEAFESVDNDAFVNLGAITFLHEAAELVRWLGEEPPEAWAAVADGMVIPIDPRTGAIINHDGYRPDEPLGETPEAAAALFPLGHRVDPDVEAATLRYAMTHQVPRFVGTPMLSAVLGVYAAWLGRRAEAADLFERGYGAFFDDPFDAPDEFPAADEHYPQASPMLANLGAFLCSLYYGLPGIRPGLRDPATWAERRVVLPAGWRSIEVERLWIRGQPMRLVARQGSARAVLEP